MRRRGWLAAHSIGDSGDAIDHGPAEPGEQAQRSGKIGEQQRNLLFPGEHGFDGEFRKRLQPGEDGERETLGHEELGRFRRPGDEHGGEQNSRARSIEKTTAATRGWE